MNQELCEFLKKIEIVHEMKSEIKGNTFFTGADNTEITLKGYDVTYNLGCLSEITVSDGTVEFADVYAHNGEEVPTYHTKGVYPVELIEKVELSL